jgi:hypothetical protein
MVCVCVTLAGIPVQCSDRLDQYTDFQGSSVMFHFVRTDLLKWGSCQMRRVGPYIPSFPFPSYVPVAVRTGTTGVLEVWNVVGDKHGHLSTLFLEKFFRVTSFGCLGAANGYVLRSWSRVRNYSSFELPSQKGSVS